MPIRLEDFTLFSDVLLHFGHGVNILIQLLVRLGRYDTSCSASGASLHMVGASPGTGLEAPREEEEEDINRNGSWKKVRQ